MYKKIVAQTTLYGISNTLSKLSGLILLPFYTGYLSKADYGLMSLFESVAFLIIPLSGMGLRAALPRWYWLPEKADLKKQLYFSVVVASLFFCVLIALGGYYSMSAFTDLIFRTTVPDVVLEMFTLSVFFRILNELPFLILRINQKTVSQTAYQSFNLFLTVVLTYYYLVMGGRGLEGIFLAQTISAVATLVVMLPVVVKHVSPVFLTADFKAMIRFGFPLAVSNVLSNLLGLSDRFILNYFKNIEEVGTFSLAYKVANVLQLVVITSFLSAYTHLFYQGMNRTGNKQVFSKAPTWFWLLIIVSAMGLTLFGKEIIVVTSYSNPEYWSSIDVLPLLVAGLLFGGLRQLFVLDLSYHHQTRAISISIIASGIINVLLNIALIPFLDANGAALATALTQLLVSVFLYQRIRKVSLVEYELKKMAVAFLLGAVISIAAIFINHWDLGLRLGIKLFMFASFFLGLWLWGYFDVKEIEVLKGFWAKWRNPQKFVANVKQFRQDEADEH